MSGEPAGPDREPAAAAAPAQPSLVPGVALLGIAAVLIVVVLVKPDMPPWLRYTIAGVAVLVVILLLIFAARLFRTATRRGQQ